MAPALDLNSTSAPSSAPVASSDLQLCGLCKRPAVLQRSHLLPAWCYRRIIADSDDLQPVQITKDSAVFSNEQVREYLLCRKCEEKLGKIEDKVKRLTGCKSGKQRIFCKLNFISDTSGHRHEMHADTAGNLSYFAASVIWRAHAMGKGCELGPYGEKFRQFLLGEGSFPTDAFLAVMIIQPSESGIDPRGWLTSPSSTRVDGFRIHGFIASGLVFRLFVGQRLPAVIKRWFLGHPESPRCVVAVRPWNECQDAWGALELLNRATPRGKLARMSGA